MNPKLIGLLVAGTLVGAAAIAVPLSHPPSKPFMSRAEALDDFDSSATNSDNNQEDLFANNSSTNTESSLDQNQTPVCTEPNTCTEPESGEDESANTDNAIATSESNDSGAPVCAEPTPVCTEPTSDSSHSDPAPQTNSPKTIKVWLNTFIPDAMAKDPAGRCFTGDNRNFSSDVHASSRTHQEIEFDVESLTKTINWRNTGETHRVDCETGNVLETGKAPESSMTNGEVTRSGEFILVQFKAASQNPLITAPAIDLDVTFRINPATREVWLVGEHDGFPAYEAYIAADGGAGVPIYSHDPRQTGDSPISLFPPMDKKVETSATNF